MKRIIIGMAALISSILIHAQKPVDVHTHIILPEYKELLQRHGAELEETFPLPDWDAERHIAFMDSAGIGCTILTMPAPQPYYGDVAESAACIRRINEASAEVKAKYPGRFKFCASLPLPDVDAAIRETVYALDTLGADGIKLATNSRGQYLGDKELDPLMEVLNERPAVIIIHPHRPTPYPENIIKTTPLAMYEYPAETTRSVANMLARNVLVRYPNLKVVVPHCGSFLPLAVPRMKSILPAMVGNGYMQPIDWEGNLSRLYYDLAGNPTAEVIRALLTITSPEHIFYGSDYPYLPEKVLQNNLNRLKETLAADSELSRYAEMFLWGNASRLFNIKHVNNFQTKKNMKKNIGQTLALYPTPAVVVGTEVNGKVNWLLVAHVGIIGHDHIMLSMHKAHYSNQGVKATGKVSVNMVDEAMLQRADYVGCVSGAKTDKSEVFAWHPGEAGTPVIDESPLVMECEVVDNYETDTFDNFICKITNTYAEENILNDKGKPDYNKLKPVLFEMPNYTYLQTGDEIAKCTTLGKEYKQEVEQE